MSDDIIRSVDFRNKINTQSLEILRDLGDGDRLVLEIILQMQKNDALHLEILRNLTAGPKRLEQSVSGEEAVVVEEMSDSASSLDDLEDVAEGDYEAPFSEQLSAIVASLDGKLEDDDYEALKNDLTQTPPSSPEYWIRRLHDEGQIIGLGQPEVARKLALLFADHIQELGEYSNQNSVVCALYEIGLTDRALELVTELRTRWSGEGFGEELSNLFERICYSQSGEEHSFMTPDALREFGQDILTRFDDLDIVLSVFDSVANQTKDEDWALQIARALVMKLSDVRDFYQHGIFLRGLANCSMEALAPVRGEFAQTLVQRTLEDFFENTEDLSSGLHNHIENIAAQESVSAEQLTKIFETVLSGALEEDIGVRYEIGRIASEQRNEGRLDAGWSDAFIERIYDQMVDILEEHAPEQYFYEVVSYCLEVLGDDQKAAQLFYRFEEQMRAQAEEEDIDLDWLDELSEDAQAFEGKDGNDTERPFIFIAMFPIKELLDDCYGQDTDNWPEELPLAVFDPDSAQNRNGVSEDSIPKSFADYLSQLLSDFVEYVSIRMEDAEPCFLRINRGDDSPKLIRLNPEPVVPGVTYSISRTVRVQLARSLMKFAPDELFNLRKGKSASQGHFEGEIQIAIVSNSSDHWDRNFLKLSEAVGGMYFKMLGWHEVSKTYGIQTYTDGDYDSGIEVWGQKSYYDVFKDEYLREFFTPEDFSIATYLNKDAQSKTNHLRKYRITYDKPAFQAGGNACSILWESEERIFDLEPYVSSIITRDGEGYRALLNEEWPLSDGRSDFQVLQIESFEVIPHPNEAEFSLCFEAVVALDLGQHPNFRDCLEKNGNSVLARIDFKKDGAPMVDAAGTPAAPFAISTDHYVTLSELTQPNITVGEKLAG